VRLTAFAEPTAISTALARTTPPRRCLPRWAQRIRHAHFNLTPDPSLICASEAREFESGTFKRGSTISPRSTVLARTTPPRRCLVASTRRRVAGQRRSTLFPRLRKSTFSNCHHTSHLPNPSLLAPHASATHAHVTPCPASSSPNSSTVLTPQRTP
jgi:hypothetical protein